MNIPIHFRYRHFEKCDYYLLQMDQWSTCGEAGFLERIIRHQQGAARSHILQGVTYYYYYLTSDEATEAPIIIIWRARDTHYFDEQGTPLLSMQEDSTILSYSRTWPHSIKHHCATMIMQQENGTHLCLLNVLLHTMAHYSASLVNAAEDSADRRFIVTHDGSWVDSATRRRTTVLRRAEDSAGRWFVVTHDGSRVDSATWRRTTVSRRAEDSAGCQFVVTHNGSRVVTSRRRTTVSRRAEDSAGCRFVVTKVVTKSRWQKAVWGSSGLVVLLRKCWLVVGAAWSSILNYATINKNEANTTHQQ